MSKKKSVSDVTLDAEDALSLAIDDFITDYEALQLENSDLQADVLSLTAELQQATRQAKKGTK